MSRNERLFLGIFLITLLIGIWQALPEISSIGDESLYVGGVLRALQAHTLVPQIDNAYTLSFFANYVLMIPVVGVLFIVAHFHMSMMLALLYSHYELLYLVPRFVSVLASLGIAYLLIRLAILEGHDQKRRLLAVTLALTPVIVVAIMHTGKMWALSSLLILMADYFCIRALKVAGTESDTSGQPQAARWYRSPVFWCVGSAFLAFANFPIALVAFSAPALVAGKVWRERSSRRLFIWSSVLWGLVFLGLTFLNLHGWTAQNAATPPGALHPFAAVLYQLALVPLLMPFLLIGVLAHLDGIRNRVLFFLPLAQASMFLVLVAVRAPWVLESTDYLRYFFLVALLLGVALLGMSLKRWRVLVGLAALSCIFFVKTLSLFVVPTTYNEALDWVTAHMATQPVVVVNTVPILDLPRNATSYALLKSDLCASRCQQEISEPTSLYTYTLITGESDPAKIASIIKSATYQISATPRTNAGTLVASFGQSSPLSNYYDMNHRLGLSIMPFLALPALGENIYVYKAN